MLQPNLDIGTFAAFDGNDLNKKELSSRKDEHLKEVARRNIQILLSTVWELPTQRIDGYIVANLPKPTFILPREKPIPKPKPLTKWQKYVRDKGLKTTKKAKLTWDDILKKWVPRYGYKKKKAENEKNWILEVPANADPMIDMFEQKKNIKQEKVSKNELQRLHNIARAKNIKVPTVGLPPTPNPTSKQLNTVVQVANIATTSLGKFQPKLSKEKTLNKTSILYTKKRNLPMPSQDEEYKRNMKIVDSILNKKPKLDLDKAVSRELFIEQNAISERESQKSKKGKRKVRQTKDGKGNRRFKSGGRKRR